MDSTYFQQEGALLLSYSLPLSSFAVGSILRLQMEAVSESSLSVRSGVLAITVADVPSKPSDLPFQVINETIAHDALIIQFA